MEPVILLPVALFCQSVLA